MTNLADTGGNSTSRPHCRAGAGEGTAFRFNLDLGAGEESLKALDAH